MKKILKTSFIFLIIGLIAGVFYREFTKIMDFSGRTSLSVLHTHTLVLGVLVPIIYGLVLNALKQEFTVINTLWTKMYVISVSAVLATLTLRGVLDVVYSTGKPISSGLDAAVSGIAGLSHIALGISVLVVLYQVMKIAEMKK